MGLDALIGLLVTHNEKGHLGWDILFQLLITHNYKAGQCRPIHDITKISVFMIVDLRL